MLNHANKFLPFWDVYLSDRVPSQDMQKQQCTKLITYYLVHITYYTNIFSLLVFYYLCEEKSFTWLLYLQKLKRNVVRMVIL